MTTLCDGDDYTHSFYLYFGLILGFSLLAVCLCCCLCCCCLCKCCKKKAAGGDTKDGVTMTSIESAAPTAA